MLHRVGELRNLRVHATDGDVGRVHDLYFDDQRWTIRYLVVDASHWLAGRKVLVSPISVLGVHGARARIDVALTRAEIRHSPDIDTDKPVARQNEIAFHEYFSFPYYWTGGELWGPVPLPGDLRDRETSGGLPRGEPRERSPEPGGDRHLRSTRVVAGYFVQARDGEIGHVDDFLVDDASWAIRDVVVDTRNWWPGKRVLVPAAAIEWVSWIEMKVHVGLRRDAILGAPAYDASRPLHGAERARLRD